MSEPDGADIPADSVIIGRHDLLTAFMGHDLTHLPQSMHFSWSIIG